MLDHLLYSEQSPLLFTQTLFWVFFAGVLLCYQTLHTRIFARNFFLMIFSLYFYYLSSGWYFGLLVFSTYVDYYIGKWIHASQDPLRRKRLVTASVVINLATLAYFKYAYFFTDQFNLLTGADLQTTNFLAAFANEVFALELDIHKIILPVGISFYTFQTISYSVDIYRREIEPVKNIWDFAFYVSFFPQLVAGPIVRASDFVPQIYRRYELSEVEYGQAIYMILCGLTKKILISDYVSVNFVDRVFESPGSFSGFENLMATYGYAIQIYCDFSGYTDIAIGLSLLLGFRLPANFKSPYKSLNITDFWRRWHISLSSWLRDYLYISLGGNRKGRVLTYLFLLTTMLLGGLWHGAHVRFIVWGALHGAALALHKMWMEVTGSSAKEADHQPVVMKVFWGLITFHFVCLCWIFFRAADMDRALQVITQITTNFRLDLIGEMLQGYAKVFAVIVLGFVMHLLPTTWKEHWRDRFVLLPDFVRATAILILLLVLFQVHSAESQPFIYFQF